MKKKILVLGGGFAGVQTAIELEKLNQFEVTLISDRDYLFLYPVSIWIPVHKKEFEDVKVPISEIIKKYPFQMIQDKVNHIHPHDQTVECEKKTYFYDYLVIAIGADKMKHKGIENTLSICGKPEVSLEIRKRLDYLVAKGKGRIAIGFGGNPKDKSAVRGGPAFELMFNIHNFLKKKGLREKFDLTFFAPMQDPGARMGQASLKMLEKVFLKYNIHRQFGKKMKEFLPDGILLEDESKLDSDLTLFIPAGSGNAVLQDSGLPLSESGFVLIEDSGLVKGSKNIFAVGDVAFLEGPDWVAKQGHIAEVMGRNAVHNILQLESGGNDWKGYQEHLNILCVMDTGKGASFVFRNEKKAYMIPLPVMGHWMKKGWGFYAKWTKLGKFPRIPGL